MLKFKPRASKPTKHRSLAPLGLLPLSPSHKNICSYRGNGYRWPPNAFATILSFFLDASSHLYKRVCPSVRRSVGPSVCPSVRPSVRPLRLLENHNFRQFSAARMSRIKSNTRYDVLRETYGTTFFHLSFRPSRAQKSIHKETHSGRIIAWSGLFYWGTIFFLISAPFSFKSTIM